MLGAFLVVGGLCSSQPKMSAVEQEPAEEWCPPCDFFFRRLEENEETGKLSQIVSVQERGEPKSGTGLMMDWATGALDHTCVYLQHQYGEATCLGIYCIWQQQTDGGGKYVQNGNAAARIPTT